MDAEVSSSQPKKRAPRCERLDEPQIRREIEFLYSVLLWKVDNIRVEVNKTHSLNATKYQYRDRLHKWGCRQRLNSQEYHKLYQELSRREKSGTQSKVLLNGIVNIPDNRIRKWISRNITFTKKIMSTETEAIENPEQHPDIDSAVQIHTPPSSHVTSASIVKRHVPFEILYNLPIWQASIALSHLISKQPLTQGTGDLAFNNRQANSYISLLRCIIYQASNGLINIIEIHNLLDKVEKLGAREALKELLSNTSAPTLATCESLMSVLYIRNDSDMLAFIRNCHPNVGQDFYSILLDATSWYWYAPGGRYKVLEELLINIETAGCPPKNIVDAESLLKACKIVSGDISLFLRLWDRESMPVETLHFLGDGELTHLFSMNDPVQLKEFLDLGLIIYPPILLLFGTILGNHWERFLILIDHMDLKLSIRELELMKYQPRDRIWEVLEHATFLVFLEDSIPYLSHIQPIRTSISPKYQKVEFLVLMAILVPEIAEYVIQILKQISPSISVDLLVSSTGRVLLCWDYISGISWKSLGITKRQLSIRDTLSFWQNFLLAFSIDLNQTDFWQRLIWIDLFGHRDAEVNTIRFGLVESSIANGAVVDMKFPAETFEQLNISLKTTLNLSEPIRAQLLDSAQPIDIAFLLESSDLFLLFLANSRNSDDFIERLTSRRYGICMYTVDERLLQAIRDRDPVSIRSLWRQRQQGAIHFVQNIHFLWDLSDIETTTHGLKLLSECNNNPQIISLVLITGKAILAYSSDSNGYKVCSNLLQAYLSLGTNLLSMPEFPEYIEEYRHCLEGAILNDSSEVLSILLEFGMETRPEFDNSLSTKLVNMGLNPVPLATRRSLRCLKVLVELGFCINRPGNFLSLNNRTPLGEAIAVGHMDTIIYLLQQGANIYAPTEEYSFAIAYAIRHHRIDSIVLFLELHPESRSIIKSFAEKPDFRYIKDYIPNL